MARTASCTVGTSGTTNVEATGAEPSRITITGQGAQGLGFKTTDHGTALNLQVKNSVPPRLTATVQRGTWRCHDAPQGDALVAGHRDGGPDALRLNSLQNPVSSVVVVGLAQLALERAPRAAGKTALAHRGPQPLAFPCRVVPLPMHVRTAAAPAAAGGGP